MEGNIGWKYNKAYYYNLQGDPSNGNLLKKQNDELLDTIYDDSLLKQLLDVWKNVIAKDKNIFQVELTTSYPGLITGIGVNHQTTLEWMIKQQKSLTRFLNSNLESLLIAQQDFPLFQALLLKECCVLFSCHESKQVLRLL